MEIGIKTASALLMVSLLIVSLAACTDTVPIKADTEPTATSPIATNVATDVEYLCDLIVEKYTYYPSRSQSWTRACKQAKTEALTATTRLEQLEVFERMLDALYDSHVSLGTNSGQSPRLTPSGSDVWLKAKDGDVYVVGIRPDGGADKAGVKIDDIVTSIHGQSPKTAAMKRIRTNQNTIINKRMHWAINAAAAGFRNEDRTLGIVRNGVSMTLNLGDPEPNLDLPLVSSYKINENIGYIKLNNSLGQTDTIKVFDQALEDIKDSKAWVLDLRDTPNGGNTDVAEPILGRFIKNPQEYQRIIEAEPYNREVSPRGPWTVNGPLIVLVGRWTGSMGEGMAIGLDGMERGVVMGSKMAGLAGGTNSFTLPATNIPVSFPTYDLRHLDGTPRHLWMPTINVSADTGSETDEALETAIAHLIK